MASLESKASFVERPEVLRSGAALGHHAEVRRPLIALAAVLGIMAAIGTVYLYVDGASVPQQPADPLALAGVDGVPIVKVGSCVGGSIQNIEVQATEDVFMDGSDPIVWSFRPEDGSARTITIGSPGETSVPWSRSALQAQAFDLIVTVGNDQELAMSVDPRDLADGGTIVEGERRTRAQFDAFSTGTCDR